MYKLLVLDLDDTLLADDLTIPKNNLNAIREAEERGIHVVLCSGRPKNAMTKYAEMLDRNNDEGFIVSYNGAVINQFDGKRVKYEPIEGEVLKRFIEIGEKHNIDVQLYAEDLTVGKYTDRTKMYEELTGFPATVVPDLKAIESSIKVLFNHPAGEALENLRLELLAEFSEDYNIFYSKPFYIEVLKKSVSKGTAVEYLAEKLGIKREEIIAVGDGFNDVSMIEYAGLGVAVANAPDGVKAIADFITDGTNNDGAVAEIYEKFIK